MKITFTLLLTALALASSSAVAQEQNNRERERGGERRSPEEFRQRMNERLKSSLKVTDEEWSVIQPLMEKVQAKQRDAAGSRFGGIGRGRGGGDRGGDGERGGDQGGRDRSDRPGAAESQALRTALENESSSPEELKAKLTAVREQRKKAAAELEQAREELRKVLTLRQEAALVAMGILE